LPTDPISLDNAYVFGAPTARVAVVEFADFQCPYCGQFASGSFSDIRAKYVDTGKVRFAFVSFPLEQIHPFALDAAVAADCGSQQGRFWEMHDRLFAGQATLTREAFLAHAQSLHLDLNRFTSCLDKHDTVRMREAEAEGRVLGVTGTPTFFVGSVGKDGRVLVAQRLVGALAVDRFSAVIDPLLARELAESQ
jgi:protein-disulfide isomerase